MKKGQVWVETVIYTLIGLSLIGLVLAVVTPQINKYKDKAVIDQTLSSLNTIDSKINEILSAPGNLRVIEFRMKRGEIFFDAERDNIFYVLNDSSYLFSEPGQEVFIGKIKAVSYEGVKKNSITLSLDYNSSLDITVDSENKTQKLSQSPTPYKLSLENQGFSNLAKEIIDIKVIS